MSVDLCRPIELPVVPDVQGNLVFAEAGEHVPFEIARVFVVYGVPTGAQRGGHCHRRLEQALFCLSGEMEVAVTDGRDRRRVRLADPRAGIYLPPLVWHDLGRFSPGTVYMVLTSEPFDETDYVRDHGEYLRLVGADEVSASVADAI